MLTLFLNEGCSKTCGVEISHFLTPCKIRGGGENAVPADRIDAAELVYI